MFWNRPSEPSQDAIQQLCARMEKTPTPGQLQSIDIIANEALDVALVAELVRFVVLDKAFKSWSTHSDVAFQAYASSLLGIDREVLAVSVLMETPSHVMDRRFMVFDGCFKYRNPHIAVTIKAWARGNAPILKLGNGAQEYEQTCICALPYLLTARNWPPPPILCLQTLFPHQDVLVRHQQFTIFQCVSKAMYIDAISLDYKMGNGGTKYCSVGLFQPTINTHSHADSYMGVASSRELSTFLEKLNCVHRGIRVHISFFWMVRELEWGAATPGDKPGLLFAIQGNKLKLEPHATAAKFPFPDSKFAFMKDFGRLYNVSVAGREARVTVGRHTTTIDEYVFRFQSTGFLPPTFIPAHTTGNW